MASIKLPNQKVANVSIESVLVPGVHVKPEWVDACRNACVKAALSKACQLWGSAQSVTIRDLNATDMSYTNNIYTETSNATANQWNAMAFGAFTVPTATVIGVYGLKILALYDAAILRLPITGIRIDVGGARVAQWNVQSLDQTNNAGTSVPIRAQMGVTFSPIAVGEDITVTIYEYTRTASTVYTPTWLGVTVEKEGRTLKP